MLYLKSEQKQTNEYKFLCRFMDSAFFSEYVSSQTQNYLFLQEPFTGIGYPDLVFIEWDEKLNSLWNENRNKLKNNDIKILHYLYMVKEKKSIVSIQESLGYTEAFIEKALQRLDDANLVNFKNGKYASNPITNIFYIKKLISIEAKLFDWKRAREQAQYNCLFSSDSFVLFPEQLLNERIINEYSECDVGIITYEKKYKVVKKPRKNHIPSTFHSWQFNEYIGRRIWKENLQCSMTMS